MSRHHLKFIWACYNRFLESHPFSSSLATAGFLYGAGDLLCQGIEIAQTGATKSKGVQYDDAHGIFTVLDYGRTARMTAYGTVVFGISSFYWYKWLDTYLLHLSANAQVVTKVALDASIYAPFCIATLFGCLSAMEGKNQQQIKCKIKRDFWPTYKVDLLFWPALQSINFYWLPLKYRIMYVSVCSLVWNIFLSSMHNRDVEGSRESAK